MEDWKRVIWSNETKIKRIGLDGQEYVWKSKEEGLIAREVQDIVKLSEVKGRMDADQYVAILK